MIGIPPALPPPVDPEGNRNEQLWIEFAKAALGGYCANPQRGSGEDDASCAANAANAMLAEHVKRFRLKEPDFGAMPKCAHVNQTKNFANHTICADCGVKIKAESIPLPERERLTKKIDERYGTPPSAPPVIPCDHALVVESLGHDSYCGDCGKTL